MNGSSIHSFTFVGSQHVLLLNIRQCQFMSFGWFPSHLIHLSDSETKFGVGAALSRE
jgi:hypothetical protein